MSPLKTEQRKSYWRSLREVENTPEFQEMLHREFPVAASEFPDHLSRRRWMQLMGASLALGGLAGCRWEVEQIAPFAARPEGRIPGEPEYYATSAEIAGEPAHLLVTCYDGRPIKVEGNPDHPVSRGSTDRYAQASILGLYDPDRSSFPRERSGGQVFARDWTDVLTFLNSKYASNREFRGEGFAVLHQPTTSVTMRAMLNSLVERFPKANIFEYSPTRYGNSGAALRQLYGQPVEARYRVRQARVIACFDADLLHAFPGHLRHAREFAERRDPSGEMNRLYVSESQLCVTGAAADHRLARKSSQIGTLVARLDELVRGVDHGCGKLDTQSELFVSVLAEDLTENRGRGVVVVGDGQPAAVHMVAQLLNDELGNVGQTVYLEKSNLGSDSIVQLVDEMKAGQVETLLILGGNPVYDTAGELAFADALQKVENSIHVSPYFDETSTLATWHLPESHAFESWHDVRSIDGDCCVAQPLIEPLLNGKSQADIIAAVIGDGRPRKQRVRDAISTALSQTISDADWNRLIHDGFVANSNRPTLQLEPNADNLPAIDETLTAGGESAMELVFTESDTVFDGRFANNGWLQETPDALTKLTWDNAALVSPSTARALKVEHGDQVSISRGGKQLDVPVFVLPGQAEGTIGLALGYGRTHAGHIGGFSDQGVEVIGRNAYPLQPLSNTNFTTDFSIEKIDGQYSFATTQDHFAIDTVGQDERQQRVGDLVREATVEQFAKDPHVFHHAHHHEDVSLWQEPSYDGNAWGMAIDLNKCIGCNACVVACQAENNIPIVGREQVSRGREMHWIRVDRYFSGDPDDPQVATQPVACHHCENAPCEQVCPVAATVHSDEGLNDMVYNRCIGTRYCANNCPYKVRRFNFFDYNEKLEEPNRQLAQLVINPEVTVRNRGVMEKCTYCVQRIQSVKIDAKNGDRAIRDGELKTACQQACPTVAIDFGDLNARSRVAQRHADSRSYAMLAELNVKPRTKYLGRIRNPHPRLTNNDSPSQQGSSDHGHR